MTRFRFAGAAEVYSPLGGVEQTDYTKRGGRYTSDFIWNTKWKDQVCVSDDCLLQFAFRSQQEVSVGPLVLIRKMYRVLET